MSAIQFYFLRLFIIEWLCFVFSITMRAMGYDCIFIFSKFCFGWSGQLVNSNNMLLSLFLLKQPGTSLAFQLLALLINLLTVQLKCFPCLNLALNVFDHAKSLRGLSLKHLFWDFDLINLLYLILQSSALGFLLAQRHFTNPLVAVPSAVSVVCMAVRLLHSFFLGDIFIFILILYSYLPSCSIRLVLISKYFFFHLYSLAEVLQQSSGGTGLFQQMTKTISRNRNQMVVKLECLVVFSFNYLAVVVIHSLA